MKRTKRLLISLLTLLCCCTGAWATGELNGKFTINASGDKVQFSQGNLQATYNGSSWSWAFATNQWDYIGNAASNTSINGNGTVSTNGTVDLFGWVGASSSWTGAAMYGISNSTATNAENGYGNVVNEALKSDWGNTIGAGWRTLTSDEWKYILSDRASGSTVNGTSNARYTHATINTDSKGVNGMILFPDGVTIANDEATSWGGVNSNSAWGTRCTADQWTALAAKGCVFLPAAGMRDGTSVGNTQSVGYYQSSSPHTANVNFAWSWYFASDYLGKQYCNRRNYAYSVRLVKDYQLQQDGEGNYLLSSAQDWKDFAAIVNSGTNPAANAKMTADIDLGDDQTHIGDNNNLSYAYRGVFDGQGHKLNVNYYSSSSSTGIEGGYSIAPFRNINGATIKNLAVTGNITGYMHCAGVVGYAVSPSTNLINNVTVSANITILNTHGGGFIGHNETATTTIQDCLFNGTISGGSTVGVFFGWSGSATMSLINCLENGSYTNCSTFTPTSCPGYAVSTVTNCYYAVSGSYPGTHATSAQLSDGTIATALQNGRAEEVWVQDPVTNQPMLKLFATKAYTVPSSGIGTFSAKAKFTVPDGLTAHYCKTYDKENGTIGVVDIDGAVPANTGVLLKGTPGETYTLTGTNNEAATVTGNALVAVTEATHVNPIDGTGEYTNFMLKSGTFIRIADSDDDVKMPANRAYLQIQTSDLPVDSQLTRAIRLSWGGGVTDVPLIDNGQLIIHNYALPAKRIVKGKLIIEKNGQMFNANGQLIK